MVMGTKPRESVTLRPANVSVATTQRATTVSCVRQDTTATPATGNGECFFVFLFDVYLRRRSY